MSQFMDKTLMITGGTGSFGNAVLNRFLRTDIGEIRETRRSRTICATSFRQECRRWRTKSNFT